MIGDMSLRRRQRHAERTSAVLPPRAQLLDVGLGRAHARWNINATVTAAVICAISATLRRRAHAELRRVRWIVAASMSASRKSSGRTTPPAKASVGSRWCGDFGSPVWP